MFAHNAQFLGVASGFSLAPAAAGVGFGGFTTGNVLLTRASITRRPGVSVGLVAAASEPEWPAPAAPTFISGRAPR
jgi:hypothetical protein